MIPSFSLPSCIQDIYTKNECQIDEEVGVILIWEYLIKTPKLDLNEWVHDQIRYP